MCAGRGWWLVGVRPLRLDHDVHGGRRGVPGPARRGSGPGGVGTTATATSPATWSDMLEIMLRHFGPRVARTGSPWSAPAEVAQASWFFANLYEAVVDMPRLLLDARQQRR